VRALVTAAGGVSAVLNTRHAISKEKGWKDAPPSVEEFAAAVGKEPNLIRRPILVAGKKAIVGFDEEAYKTLKKTN
jgi:arsenate reductase-like glutaredoxin family protein